MKEVSNSLALISAALQKINASFIRMDESRKQKISPRVLAPSQGDTGNSSSPKPGVQNLVDERYIPPHRREETGKGINLSTARHGNNGNGANSIRIIPNNQVFGRTNPNLQPGIYDLESNQQGRGSGGSVHQGQILLPQGQMTLPPGNLPFPQGQNAIPQPYLPISQAPRGGGVDLDAVRDVV